MKNFLCIYCDKHFSKRGLDSHNKTSRTCLKFKRIKFICKGCSLITDSFDDIESHLLICDNQENSHVEDKDKIIQELRDIIKEQVIKIDVYKDIINGCMKRDIEESDRSPDKKRPYYMSVKKQVDLIPEKTETDIISHIQTVEEEIIEENDLLKYSKKECEDIIEEKMVSIKESKSYMRILANLKKLRITMIRFMNMDFFIKFLQTQISYFKDTFRFRGFDEKKINNLIKEKCLSPLELRLLFYEEFETTTIEIEEITTLKKCLKILMSSKKYTIFIRDSFINSILNYSASLFSIEEIIEVNLINIYGFNNCIYLNLPKSTTDDPFSFYHLEKIDKDKRYWKMDCRLEELGFEFISNMVEFYIKLYRKLYFIVFNDNNYRDNVPAYSTLLEVECAQIVQNIIILSDKSKIYKSFQKIIYEKAVYTPTEKDKFNLSSDDCLQKRKFSDYSTEKYIEKTYNRILENLKELFDECSKEEVTAFYESSKYIV